MRIVVVDDDRGVREALRRSLEFNGYTVELAEDGQQAMDAVGRRRPDAMVLDMTMPRLDGLEVCRRLRSAGDNLPVLVLTARDAVSDRVAGLDAGADDYLPKPFLLEELLARLRALLRRRPPLDLPAEPGAPVTVVDGDPLTHEANSPSPSIEVAPADIEKVASSRPAKRHVRSKTRLITTLIGVASVIIAAIGLIPPFKGAFWTHDNVNQSDSQNCIKFSDINGIPPVIAHTAARVEVRPSGQGYTRWLVVTLTLTDGNVIIEERPIVLNPDTLVIPLDFLSADGMHHILIVEVGIVGTAGGSMGACS
jgi:two-component system response regulator MprA